MVAVSTKGHPTCDCVILLLMLLEEFYLLGVLYIQYVYIALKCFHRCRFSRKAEVKWHFCLICVKPLILFSSCGLQKVGWWVAPWSKIQRSHRPFLKSAWYLVTYITPMLLHLITSNRRLIHTARGSRPLELALNTRSVEPFQLNHDSQAGIDSVKRLRQVGSEPTAAPFKLYDPKRNTSQLLLDKTPV